MRRPTRSTPARANRMHRAIPRPVSASTSRLTEAARGRNLPPLRLSLMATSCGDAPEYTGPAFNGRSISSIVVDGSTLYVGSTRGVRGVSSVTGGTVSLAPGLPPYGLWKSTDGGANFTLLNAEGVCLNSTLEGDAGKIQSSFGSVRGVNHIEFDPSVSSTIYAAAFPRVAGHGGGIWRSTDSGANWTQIKTALSAANISDRAEFAVTKLGNGNTRMYVGDGNTGTPARFYRTDDAAGAASFTDLTTTQNITTARVSAGTTTSSSRRRVIQTRSTSAALISTTNTAASRIRAACSTRPTLVRHSRTSRGTRRRIRPHQEAVASPIQLHRTASTPTSTRSWSAQTTPAYSSRGRTAVLCGLVAPSPTFHRSAPTAALPAMI